MTHLRAWMIAAGLAVAACGNGNTEFEKPVEPPAEPPVEPPLEPESCETNVSGIEAGGTDAYLGIPYVAPPIGDHRLKAPQKAACFEETFIADTFAPMCPQVQSTDGNIEVVGQEDCLALNIWSPKDAQGKPVLFFVHGGGNVQGSASQMSGEVRFYDGQILAERADAVVVTINYRLGLLGYMTHAGLDAESENGVSGNYATLDQIAALEWVQRNIAHFGGDPSQVLLFGESGGAVDVCVLMASPLAAGLFSSAMIQSGGCPTTTRSETDALASEAIAVLGCDGAADPIACIRELPASEVLGRFPLFVENVVEGPIPTQAHVDGWVLPKPPIDIIVAGEHNIVPLVVGVNAQETGLSVGQMTDEATFDAAVTALTGPNPAFLQQLKEQYPISEYNNSWRAAFVALTSDAKFVCSSRVVSRTAAQHGAVHRYFFSHRLLGGTPSLAAIGAFHGLELFFIFNHLDVGGYSATAADQSLADAMGVLWGDVARGDMSAWPAYDLQSEDYLLLDGEPMAASGGIRNPQCDFWASLQP